MPWLTCERNQSGDVRETELMEKKNTSPFIWETKLGEAYRLMIS